MRPVHMAVLEAAHAHAALSPSCSGKASCCAPESLHFQLYLGSTAALGCATAASAPRLPACPHAGWRACDAALSLSPPRTAESRF